MIDKVREVALKTLYEIEKNGAFSNIALDKELNKARKLDKKLDNRDVGFVSELVYGTVSWKLTIDEIIKKYSNIKLKKISLWILSILRMSVYQIVFLDKVPKSATVNEAVELSKKYGHKASTSFVNAILRKVNKTDYDEFFEIKNDVERISKTTSMPIWIVEKLVKQMPLEKAKQICENSNIKPKLYIRVNTLKTDKQSIIKKLEKEKIEVKDEIDDFLEIKGIRNIENLDIFKQGLFTVQDIQAGRIPIILNPQPNEKVLDACSSPGGKTTYIAQLMKNNGSIIAWDIYEHRVELVKKTTQRLGINIIQTQTKDATIYEEKYFEYFDKILLDVPCLGLGVIKRKPDIKWQRKPEDINEITKIQKQILENCSKYLKNGGILVYSTCSILKEENEDIVKKFVEKNKNFEILETSCTYQNEKTDGFFDCKIRKVK